MPRSKLNRVKPGFTKAQVLELLGTPEEFDEITWIYSRWGNPGWVEVHFTKDDLVRSINDESPFP